MGFKEVIRGYRKGTGFSISVPKETAKTKRLTLYCGNHLNQYTTVDLFYDKDINSIGIKPYKSKAGKYSVHKQRIDSSSVGVTGIFATFSIPYPEKSIQVEHEKVTRDDGIKFIIKLP